MIIVEPKIIRRGLREARRQGDNLKIAYFKWLWAMHELREARADLEDEVVYAYVHMVPITFIAKRSGLARGVVYKIINDRDLLNTQGETDSDANTQADRPHTEESSNRSLATG